MKFGTRHAWVAAVDTVLLLVYIALQEPGGATGFVWHEWVGLAFIPLFVLHLVLSWRWIATTWKRLWRDPLPRTRINFLLNSALMVLMTIVTVTGLVISEYALPAVGVLTYGTRRWEQFHNFTASLIIPVAALHLALNWNWIVRAARRYVLRSAAVPMSAADGALEDLP